MKIGQKIKALLKAPLEDFQFVLEAKKNGYHEITTLFDYQHPEGVITHGFRTIVQIDADILDFIPDYVSHHRDLAWRALFEQNYALHRQKVMDFAQALEDRKEGWGRVFDGTVFLGGLYPFFDLIYNFTPDDGYQALFYGIVALIVRKYARSKAISWASEKAFGLIRWYFERKSK